MEMGNVSKRQQPNHRTDIKAFLKYDIYVINTITTN